MASPRNTRLLAGIVAAPFVVAALYAAFRFTQAAALARRSEPLQIAPTEPKKRLLILGGGNDMIRMADADALRAALSRVLFLARARSDNVVLMPSGNVGNAPFFLWPWSALMTQRSRVLHAVARQAAAANGATYVGLFKERSADPFAQEPRRLLAADRLHPSDAGYALWHRELLTQSNLSGVLR